MNDDKKNETLNNMMVMLDQTDQILEAVSKIENTSYGSLTQEDWINIQASMPLVRQQAETIKLSLRVAGASIDDAEVTSTAERIGQMDFDK